MNSESTLLQLLQLADSALPIGAVAHSFGLEALAESGELGVANLRRFLVDYLDEAVTREASYCMRAACGVSKAEWVRLNRELSAFRPAREARDASLVLGKRMLELAEAWRLMPFASIGAVGLSHLCLAFGLLAGKLGVAPRDAALSYVHQNVASVLSVCQRLLPVGQVGASTLLWSLKPDILATVDRAETMDCTETAGFQPILEIGSMVHPWMTTRLFIS